MLITLTITNALKPKITVDDVPFSYLSHKDNKNLLRAIIHFMLSKNDIAERFRHTPINKLKPQKFIEYLLPKYGTITQQGIYTVISLNI